MKNECILLSNKNYQLAYKLRQSLMLQNVELKLAIDVVQMFGFVNQNTKAIVIDCCKTNINEYAKMFSKVWTNPM